MYDLPCNDALDEQKVSLKSQAMIDVIADKYQVKTLQEKLHHKIQGYRTCKNSTDVEDFLDVLEVIMTGTARQDKWARATMISICVKHIQVLQRLLDSSASLKKHGDIGAEIIHRDRLPLMLNGKPI